MKKVIVVLIIMLAMVLIPALQDAEAQCAMCKATVESNKTTGTSKIGAGLNTGILYLMTIPYVLFAVIGYYWYKISKKNHEQRTGTESHNKGKMPQMS